MRSTDTATLNKENEGRENEMVYKALTIAGSDSGGGAGIQADLKTFQELGVFGMSALTAVTAQNTLGVQGVYPLSPEAVAQQIESVGTDLGADAVKTGMLFSAEIIEVVASKVKQFGWDRLVVDPVMIAKGGAPLLQEEAVNAMKTYLLPLAMVVTPNIPEAEALTGLTIRTMEDRKEAAKRLHELGVKYVVIKGGHDDDGEETVDVLYDGSEFFYFTSKRIDTKHTHGTGCTFAAAITAELAKGKKVQEAVQTAKSFIQAAIEHTLGIGHGHGPTNHWAYREKTAR
jgi:hydroxymethylpyrimidine/phosphomethylpyrimidine kinase